MALKTCQKCGESADEAKAFCPACGNPFVAEQKREGSSEFDKYAGTVNVTQTAYNMMRAEVFGAEKQQKAKEIVQTPVPNELKFEKSPLPVRAKKSSSILIYGLIGILVLLVGVFATIFLLNVFS